MFYDDDDFERIDDRNDQDGRLDSDSHCDAMERACASAAQEIEDSTCAGN